MADLLVNTGFFGTGNLALEEGLAATDPALTESPVVMDEVILGPGLAQQAEGLLLGHQTILERSTPDNGSKDESEKQILNLLHDWGSFKLSEKDSALAQTKLESIVKRLTQNGDPSFEVVFVNSPEEKASVTGDKNRAFVILHKGLLDLIENEDQLAGVIAHELAHTITFDKLDGAERSVQRPREELLTADKQGIERMIKAGFDPRQFILLLEKFSAKSKKEERDYDFYSGFFSSHPVYKLRISRASAEVSQWEQKASFSNPTPLDEILLEIQKTKASEQKPPARMKRGEIYPKRPPTPVPQPAPKPAKKLDIFSATLLFRRMLRDTAYQTLPPLDKLNILESFFQQQYFEDRHPHYRKDHANPGFLQKLLFLHYLKKSDSHFNTPFDFKKYAAPDPDRNVYRDFGGWEINAGYDFQMHLEQNGLAQTAYNEILSVALGSEEEGVRLHANRVADGIYFDYEASKSRSSIQEQIYPTPHFENLAGFRAYEKRIKEAYDVGLVEYQRQRIFRNLYLKAKTPEEIVATGKETDTDTLGERAEEFYWAAFKLGERKIILGEHFKNLRIGDPIKNVLAKATQDGRLSVAKRLILAYHIGVNDPDIGQLFGRIFREDIHSIQELLDVQRELQKLEHGYYLLNGARLFEIIYDHPEWKLDLDDIQALSDNETLWKKSANKNFREFYGNPAGFEWQLLQSWLESKGEKGLIDSLYKMRRDPNQGPAYDYDLKHSRQIQNYFIKRLEQSGNFPTTLIKLHELFLALAKRGVTFVTDEWAKVIYLSDKFTSAECLAEALEARVVWDFEYRKEIYDKYLRLSGERSKPQANRAETIAKELVRIDRFFPEQSLVRAQVLEEFTHAIQADHEETKLIEQAKYSQDQNFEAVALRAFNGILTELEKPKGRAITNWKGEVIEERKKDRTGKTCTRTKFYLLEPKERQIELIRFLIGKGELPEDLALFVDETIGRDRLKRQFQSLTPELRVALIDPLLRTDRGLYADPSTREKLMELALEGVGPHQKEARLLLESLLYALQQTAPHEVTFALSFIIGQIGDRSVSPAQRLRVALESMGNTGVSIGQKLYQHRLLPQEYLSELPDLQDQARRPTRLEMFEMMADVLGLDVEKIDEAVVLEKVLGSASTKVVVQVRYKDGRISEQIPRALKMLRRNFVRSTDLEIAKVKAMVGYLEKEGGPKYRRLRSALHSVERSLRLQADPLAEARNVERVRQLYQSDRVQENCFVFHVVEPDLNLSHGPLHVHEEVAPGRALKTLAGKDRALVFGAIYAMEERIVFRSANSEETITYEGDRHAGNFNVELAEGRRVVHVYDYPLVHEIGQKLRESIFKVLGLLHALQQPSGFLIGMGFRREIRKLVVDDLTLPLPDEKKAAVQRSVEKALQSFKQTGAVGISDLFLDLLASAESAGAEINPDVYDYLTTLGHIEHYAVPDPTLAGVQFSNPFAVKIRTSVEEALQPLRKKYSPKAILRHLLTSCLTRK